MESTRRHDALWALAACGFVAALLFVRISAFGIWDPWELGTADIARHLAAGEPVATPASWSTWLVSLGFRQLGVHEWAGRTPIALSGVLTVLLAYLLASRFAGQRAGVYAAIVTGTSPLFVFNARAMLGDAPAIAAQTAVGLCALGAAFPRRDAAERKPAHTLAWLAALLGALCLAVGTRGALLGALPPLAAATLTGWLTKPARSNASGADGDPGALARYALSALTLVLAGLVARDALHDSADRSLWLGGQAASLTPPTFDSVIEAVFLAFAPWTALLPLAMGRMWQLTAAVHETDARDEQPNEDAALPLRLCALLWAVFGYAAQTLFLSRYGREVTFLPLCALALLVALYLEDVERNDRRSWAAGIAALFLAGLVLRDYALYPSSPLRGMPISNFDVPKVWNPKLEWAIGLGAFGVLALLGLGSDAGSGKPQWLAPYQFVRTQWRRGLGFKLWLVGAALGLLAAMVFGVLAYAIPEQLELSTLGAKWVRRLLLLPFALPIGVSAAQLGLFVFAKLGRYRLWPMLAAGAAVGVYASQGFLPALSEHFSPREVYESYNALAQANEGLAEYRVGGRAAAYYAKGKIAELTSVSALVEHLAAKTRRWAAFPADELPTIDRAYRQRTGEHIVVADARSARVLLATNQPLHGKADQSFLSQHVRSAAPAKIQHPLDVSFDDRIQLLGYDLTLPHGSYVGAGESFKIVWYFRAKKSLPIDYRIFVHIDGEGQRIHGDHDPVGGKYPVRLWDENDVIYDEQDLDVPASYHAGDYTIFMGFYAGDSRLPVKSGPADADNRVRAGVLRIQ